jgi:hypothetical protein
VSQGISDSYLRWRGIEATLQLAQSSNSKIVVLGTGKDGLPVILGNFDRSPPPPTANEDVVPEEKTPPAAPATSSEKARPDTLTKPSQMTPFTQSR